MIQTNEQELVKFKLQGHIKPPHGYGWEICHDNVTRMLPSVGGITLNVKVGDLANRFAGDHLEPGVSCTMEHDSAKRNSVTNVAFNAFSCIGNEAVVITGSAKGKRGRVTGHHGGVEHVIIDFDDATLDKLTYDDKIMINAHGAGLTVPGIEDLRVFSLSPELLKKINPKVVNGRLEFPVTRVIPAVVMGSGLGSSDPYKGDYDIQTSDPETVRQYGLDQIRLGDIVAIADHDSTHGWSYKQGAISIGVIIHGDSKIAGHGPGCQTILTSRSGSIAPKISANANVGYYLKLGRWRKS